LSIGARSERVSKKFDEDRSVSEVILILGMRTFQPSGAPTGGGISLISVNRLLTPEKRRTVRNGEIFIHLFFFLLLPE
jgi:hypothetical protein